MQKGMFKMSSRNGREENKRNAEGREKLTFFSFLERKPKLSLLGFTKTFDSSIICVPSLVRKLVGKNERGKKSVVGWRRTPDSWLLAVGSRLSPLEAQELQNEQAS